MQSYTALTKASLKKLCQRVTMEELSAWTKMAPKDRLAFEQTMITKYGFKVVN